MKFDIGVLTVIGLRIPVVVSQVAVMTTAWIPTTSLFNGHRGFVPGAKRLGHDVDPLTPI
jgi:hypothetical protein